MKTVRNVGRLGTFKLECSNALKRIGEITFTLQKRKINCIKTSNKFHVVVNSRGNENNLN
jgi:hypothetical protein